MLLDYLVLFLAETILPDVLINVEILNITLITLKPPLKLQVCKMLEHNPFKDCLASSPY